MAMLLNFAFARPVSLVERRHHSHAVNGQEVWVDRLKMC